jgi:hypothetical protein
VTAADRSSGIAAIAIPRTVPDVARATVADVSCSAVAVLRAYGAVMSHAKGIGIAALIVRRTVAVIAIVAVTDPFIAAIGIRETAAVVARTAITNMPIPAAIVVRGTGRAGMR